MFQGLNLLFKKSSLKSFFLQIFFIQICMTQQNLTIKTLKNSEQENEH